MSRSNLAILAMHPPGPRALAVTTSCAIDFMRKPAAADRSDLRVPLAEKLGRVLAVGDCLLYSGGADGRRLPAPRSPIPSRPKAEGCDTPLRCGGRGPRIGL